MEGGGERESPPVDVASPGEVVRIRGWCPRKESGHTVEYECFVRSNFEGDVTKFAPHQALKSSACDKLTFDERVVLHRMTGVRKALGLVF